MQNKDYQPFAKTAFYSVKPHGLPMHSKAPLYDIISGVLEYKKYPEKNAGRFRHGYGYWLGGAKDGGEDFPKRLAMKK
jgi:hypothetical protein